MTVRRAAATARTPAHRRHVSADTSCSTNQSSRSHIPVAETISKTFCATTPAGKKFSFVHSGTDKALSAYKNLVRHYGQGLHETADIIVAIGGDGFMLTTLSQHAETGQSIYGMNRGTVGFLLNDYRVKSLPSRLDDAVAVRLHRLKMRVTCRDGRKLTLRALNEVSLFRQTAQAANIRIMINGQTRMERLVCDGILLATPAGSTAYNLSAHGVILPLSSNLLALTPISSFRPRRWPGALLPNTTKVSLEVMDGNKRPVSATADGIEVRDIQNVTIESERRNSLTVLFDPDQTLQDRILQEQFSN